MNTIRLAGLGCLIGGLFFFSLNLVPGPGPDGPLALLLLGLLGGPIALIAMGAIGEGRTELAGRIGAGVALLGLLSNGAGSSTRDLWIRVWASSTPSARCSRALAC